MVRRRRKPSGCRVLALSAMQPTRDAALMDDFASSKQIIRRVMLLFRSVCLSHAIANDGWHGRHFFSIRSFLLASLANAVFDSMPLLVAMGRDECAVLPAQI